MTSILAQQPPSSFPGTFDSNSLVESNKHHPPIPEPSSTGLITLAFCLILFLYIRFLRPRSQCAAGCGCSRHNQD